MKTILNNLLQHNKLTKEEAKNMLFNITEGKFNDSQIAAFLTIFQMRGPTTEEVAGFREALLEKAIKINFNDFSTIDLCGTGGDGKDTFNISTLASFVVAGAGEKVVKHGNYGVSSNCGSSNVLEYLGLNFTNNANTLKKQLDAANICFLHAPLFHPAMKSVAAIRKELAIKTFFNMLGPLVNPALPNNQMIGVYSLEVARIYNYIYQQSNKRYSIVHCLNGYDEISLTNGAKIISNESEQILYPNDFGAKELNPKEIQGGKNIKESADIFLSILQNQGTEAQNNVVVSNASVALQIMHPKKSLLDCKEIAERSLYNGAAFKSLEKLIK